MISTMNSAVESAMAEAMSPYFVAKIRQSVKFTRLPAIVAL
jgi:hypothetical protein